MRRRKCISYLLIATGTIALVATSVHSRPETHDRELVNVYVQGGSGQLQNGRAEIRLRLQFGAQTRNHEYTAHITPRDGRARGYLYVEEISPNRLVVVESGGGRSDGRFDYLIVATQWSGSSREPSQPQ